MQLPVSKKYSGGLSASETSSILSVCFLTFCKKEGIFLSVIYITLHVKNERAGRRAT
jgi:hypothetical protein